MTQDDEMQAKYWMLRGKARGHKVQQGPERRNIRLKAGFIKHPIHPVQSTQSWQIRWTYKTPSL